MAATIVWDWIFDTINLSVFGSLLQNDIEMPIPKYFVLERMKALKEREKLLGQILSRLGAQDRDTVHWHFNWSIYLP